MDKEGTPERCPFCGQPLVNAQAIAHLHRAQVNFEQRLKAEAQQEFKQQLEKEKSAIREAAQQKAAKAELLLREARKELAKAEAQAESKAQKIAATKIVAIREVEREKATKLEGQLSQMRAEKAAIRRKLVEVRAQAESEAQKIAAAKITQERSKLEANILKEVERRIGRKQRAAELTMQRLQQQNQDLQRQLQRLTAADQGELSEQDLLRAFKQEFPDDDIQRVGRGQRGADIIHQVRYRAGDKLVTAGTVVYECKDRQKWENAFLDQAKDARETHGTSHVVLVTNAFPRNQKDLYCRDGIPIVHPVRAVYLAHVIREAIIGIHRAGMSQEGQARKTMELYRYLSSEEFRLAVGRVIETSGKLKEYLHGERQDHERTWARREAAYNDLARQVAAVDGAIREIIESPAARGTGKLIPLSPSAANH